VILYVDTSALVKLYAPEPESSAVQQLVENAEIAAISLVAYAEARVALARKRREHAVGLKDYRRIIQEFNDDWDNYFIVDITEPLVKRAGQLAEKHGLRGYDAIQLFSALLMYEETRQLISFCCFDERLLRAGQREGLKSVV
jgi:predicted nucleic acid-binding protein